MRSAHLCKSGWGPGGRRFKSCLPDVRKGLVTQAFCFFRSPRLELPWGPVGDQFILELANFRATGDRRDQCRHGLASVQPIASRTRLRIGSCQTV